MAQTDKWRTFSADFETTVEQNTKVQTSTEVWSAASVELSTTLNSMATSGCTIYCMMPGINRRMSR